MKILIELLVYLMSLYFAYRLYIKFGDRLGLYIFEALKQWPDMPNWVNWILVISIAVGSFFLQFGFFVESVIVWLVLLIIAPFILLSVSNNKIFNFLSVTIFIFTSIFAVTLFFNVNNSRDVICARFITNYHVDYTTEIVQAHHVEEDDKEIEVAHIHTGNNSLDFILESIFPPVYRILLGITILLSLVLNISIRTKYNLKITKYYAVGYPKDKNL